MGASRPQMIQICLFAILVGFGLLVICYLNWQASLIYGISTLVMGAGLVLVGACKAINAFRHE